MHVKPFAVYRGQIVAIHETNETTSVVIDAKDVRLLVATSELRTDPASVVRVMRGPDT